jgi:hypothetical protein
MLIVGVDKMAQQSQCFPFEKSIVINAVYDTIEALGLKLESSNSSRGTLIISDGSHTGKMRVALGFGANVNQTQVEVYSVDGGASFAEKWSPVILDEIEGRIRRVYPMGKEE